MPERPEPPRTVKPRRPYTADLPIIAATPSGVFLETAGELRPREELADILRRHPSAYIACSNPERLLAELHGELEAEPLWQFRLSPLLRERKLEGQAEPQRWEEVIVNFFGFRRSNGKRRNRYFYPLAPGQFCRRSVRELIPGELPYWQALLRWAVALRAFCQAHDLRPSPTAGGIAAQLLRHPDFYPEPRRKVPRATNEKARPHLPGNAYELRAETDRLYGAAVYIDQADAHHAAAESLDLPHADHLRARGRFYALDGEPWIRPGSRAWPAIRATHGLFLCRLEVPPQTAGRRYVPPHLYGAGAINAWLYSNELAEVEELGARVRWISAAWTSTKRDAGLPRYARWARREVAERPDDRAWLKPTLLAAYGILAAKPRRLTFGFRHATSGEPETWPVGPAMIEVMARRTRRELQSPIANVIQRGMVEAETRRRSLRLARDLEAEGRVVLSVYADAVIVRDAPGIDPPKLPLLPEPWRVKERLSWLRFHTPQAFESKEIRRLPGVSRAILRESQKRDTKEEVPHGR